MGNQTSTTIKASTIKELAKETNFSENQIKDWYKSFLKNHPDGKCSKDEFVKTYGELFPHGDSTSFSEHVFRTYDSDKNGFIDFKEILCALKIMTEGHMEDKLKWAFSLFDKDGNGSISRSEMIEMLTVLYLYNTIGLFYLIL